MGSESVIFEFCSGVNLSFNISLEVCTLARLQHGARLTQYEETETAGEEVEGEEEEGEEVEGEEVEGEEEEGEEVEGEEEEGEKGWQRES
ncbi:hypothetical protein JOQ06_017327 [Pogonophryne albipinna]|uniref:Uncharacterized protein n=1 Tax=Pogonophryne albipinna TaxID=1090488 RepID=A0AAD6B103_9TELE|nr:hypothetical protein JOQ06_017327 [Pogonophryne albipinna]